MMDRNDVRQAVLMELRRIAPELEADQVVPAKLLHDQVDLDSMDWLNFLVALHERLKVEIPEADYSRLGTLDQIVDYLMGRMQAGLFWCWPACWSASVRVTAPGARAATASADCLVSRRVH